MVAKKYFFTSLLMIINTFYYVWAWEYSVFNNTPETLNIEMTIASKIKNFKVAPQQEAKEKTKSNCLEFIKIWGGGYWDEYWGNGTAVCWDKHLIVNGKKASDGTPLITNNARGISKKNLEISERFPKKKNKK